MIKKSSEFLSTTEAAEMLKISVAAVYDAAINRNRLTFYKVGSFNLLKKKDVLNYKRTRKVGRPRKKQLKLFK